MGRRLAAALWLLLAGTACALPPHWSTPRLADCPGPLLSSEAIPDGDFVLRERVRIVGDGVDVGLELVAERQGDRLAVVGFNAFGAKVFSAVQRGTQVEATSHLGPATIVLPANVLRDLHAARFLPLNTDERMRTNVMVARPGCNYSATFVRIERRELP